MPVTDQIAAAPISWGVCEVPGWGYQLPGARVLSDMRALGFGATEAGPDGFLPDDGAELAAELETVELSLIGGFTPLVLHDPAGGWRAVLDRALARFGRAGGNSLIIAADTGVAGYDGRPVLDADGWKVLLAALDEATVRTRDAGLRATLHPHVGTMVEGPDEIARVIDGSTVPLCLDTGHILVGGGDPVELAHNVPERINHVHLKDVDAELAARVRHGETAYSDAVRAEMFRPLGDGNVDVPALIRALTGAGYSGWYVLEQDVMLAGAPAEGAGPVADVARSRDYLTAVLSA
jgi:inosose dehydratase